MRTRRNYESLPYGAYLCGDGTTVLFDRRYHPLVRMDDGPPVLKLAAHTAQHEKRHLPLSANASPVPPYTLIQFVDQVWLYDDRTSPRTTPATRWMLANIVAKIPALENEIRHRSSK